jgi:hypothetical protein
MGHQIQDWKCAPGSGIVKYTVSRALVTLVDRGRGVFVALPSLPF